MSNKYSEKVPEFGCSGSSICSENTDFEPLRKRKDSDPMRLYNRILQQLQLLFSKRHTSYTSSQMTALSNVIEAILNPVPNTVTVAPLAPGGGKSTLLQALLIVLSKEFRDMHSMIAQKIGGVIVVVETSLEAHSLEALCNDTAGFKISVVIESANDSNLRTGGCPNGTATCFEECPRKACPDSSICPLMLASTRTHETPILILLHARYQKFMRNMESFTFWYDAENNEFPRTLLLIDELPHMFDDNATNLSTLNAAEVELDQLKASYRYEEKQQKQDVLFHWNKDVRTPFFRLMRIMQKKYRSYGLVSHNDILEAGFSLDYLEELQEKLSQYATGTLAEKIVTAIQSADTGYFTIDQTTSLMLPQLILPDMISHLSTFIFSGTATLSPEVANNPDIYMLPTNLEESYDRLKIYIQRGDDFTASKTGLVRQGNLQAVISWLKYIIPQCAQAHRKILLVTYKSVSEILWWQLKEFHDILIPYTDRSGSKAEKLPYFGGLNGSNLYQQATCVICVGLNRFEPREYLSRTLALDHVGTVIEDIRAAMELSTELRLDQLPSVLKTQDITLARDIVQLVFRSALRQHGESTPIDLWLLHPPNGVIGHLQDYFNDCHIEEINVLPESCHRAAVISKTYTGKATHAAVLLDWLCQWNGNEITPLKIREATGLTQKQFKEAKKHPAVREFFSAHIATHGSGQHTWYSRKAATDSTATVA